MTDYQSFLKPIRDLAKNWDIDIATCLEDYLGDLETITITLDGGASKMNFAEAALLIQGTSVVYAKKVEYLYTLVYKTLEALTNKKKEAAMGEKEVKDLDIQFDVELNFLLLDDMITQGKDIDLSVQDVDAIDGFGQEDVEFGRGKGRRTSGASGMSNRRLSNASAISKGSAALNASLVADIGSSGLRLMTADVDTSGALLLPGSNAFKGGEGSDDEEQDFGGFEEDMEGGYDMDGEGDDVFGNSNPVNNSVNASTMSAVSDSLGNIEASSLTNLSALSAKPTKNANDPWALVDPMAAPTVKPKSLVKGKTFTIPGGLSDQNPTSQQPGGEDPALLDESVGSANTSINKSSFVVDEEDLTLKGLAFGKEFAYVAAELKKTNAKRKKTGKKGGFSYPKRSARNNDGGVLGGDDHSDDDGFDDNNDFDDGFKGNDDEEGPLQGKKKSDPSGNVDGDQFEEMFGGRSSSSEKKYGSNPMDETMYEERFEALCKAHLRAFAAGAERYAAESQLSKRVTDWSARLNPVLVNEEEREAFDIHAVGQQMLDKIQSEVGARGKSWKGNLEDKNKVDFHTISGECEQFEVCRLFLASLMLANTGNVSLKHMDSTGGKMADNMAVEFIKNDLNLPMDTYMAPSLEVGAEGENVMPTEVA